MSHTAAAGVKQHVDLLALIGRDTRLRRVASTRGGEWAGPCPFCGGRDRLRVQPEQGVWWCRHCSDRWSDAIDYVRRRDRLSFPEACRALGADELPARPAATAAAPTMPAEAVEPEPSAIWRAAGMAFVERCEAALWSDAGHRAREYLHGRGLADETLRAWRIGFSADDAYEPAEQWALKPSTLKRGRVWLPRGIVLPWLLDGQLWQVKIRRAAGEPKYVGVTGGHPVLYGAHTLAGYTVAIATEGEFDCLLTHQEAGELAGVFTLGSCSKGLSARSLPYLLPLRCVLVAYDDDGDGERGAARLLAHSPRMRRVRVPLGKDVTEFHQRGGHIRDWVRFELARLEAAAAAQSFHYAPAAGAAAWDESAATRLVGDCLARMGEAARDLPPGCPLAGPSWTAAEQAIDRAFEQRDMVAVRAALKAYEQCYRREFDEWARRRGMAEGAA